MAHTIEKEWVTKAGLKAVCLFNRNSHRCGYVAVEPDHILWGKDYRETIPAKLKATWDRIKEMPRGKRNVVDIVCLDVENPRVSILFDVHGGINYADGGSDYPVASAESLWWFGFDCMHYGDGVVNDIFGDGYPVRTTEYVVEECEKLAEQLSEIQKEVCDEKNNLPSMPE